MKSYQAYSREIDNLELAVEEVAVQLADKPRLKNSCALVFCGFEADIKELTARLKAELRVPFIGCSAIGMLTNDGYMECGLSVVLMTADDCEFSFALTECVQTRQDLVHLQESYRQAKAALSEPEKLILAYTPWMHKMEHDVIVDVLDGESGGVPVFGGVASDGWTVDNNRVFCNDEVASDRIVILLISGNIRPLTAIEHSTSFVSEERKLVTKAKDSIVYEFDDKPALEYLREMGMLTDRPNGPWDFLGTPFFTTVQTGDGDSIEIMRCLGMIDIKNNCCHFIGRVQDGDQMNMALISKPDIEESVEYAMDKMLQKIQAAEDYEYSLVLVSSCAARYSLIVADKNVEGRSYAGKLPEGVHLQGAYVYGEFCPAKGKKTGKGYNALSNETLTLLAI